LAVAVTDAAGEPVGDPPKPTPSPYDWAFALSNLPVDQYIRATVTATEGGKTETASVAFSCRPKRKPGYGPALTISHPETGGTVGTSFLAYGYVDPLNSTMTAYVNSANGDQEAGGCAFCRHPSPTTGAFNSRG
jgi:hypothetical protein